MTASASSVSSVCRVLRQVQFDTGLTTERLAYLRFVRLDEAGGGLRLLEPGADERDWMEFNLEPDTVAALAAVLADSSWRQFARAAVKGGAL